MAITRLSGGTTPPNGSDPRTFPAIWNDAVDDIEALELPITADRIADGAVTAPKLAKTAGAVMVFDDDAARTTAIPTPVEGMVTYLKDTDAVEKFDGTNFVPVAPEPDPPKILQVVQTVQTAVFSTVSATYTPITDFTATITPISTDSKVLIMAQFPLALTATTGGQNAVARLTGGNASTYIGEAGGSREQVVLRATGNVNTQQTVIFLDSPSTTSPLTYGVEVRGIGSTTPTLFVGSNGPDTDAADFTRAPRSITVMEVAG